MADEKILNDEVMSDEQLENVVGGNAAEIQDDANKLRELGILGDEPVNQFQVRAAFSKLSSCGIAFGYYGLDKPNEYYAPVRGELKKVDRKYFWEHIHKQMQKF